MELAELLNGVKGVRVNRKSALHRSGASAHQNGSVLVGSLVNRREQGQVVAFFDPLNPPRRGIKKGSLNFAQNSSYE